MTRTLSWQVIGGYLATLVALHSPLAAAAAYGPIVGRYSSGERKLIAARLFVLVAGVLVSLVMLGELLVAIIGVSTQALGAAGGLALL